MTIKLKYKMGQKIKSLTHIYVVSGFEYAHDTKTIQYKLLYVLDGQPKYIYLTKMEIDYIS